MQEMITKMTTQSLFFKIGTSKILTEQKRKAKKGRKNNFCNDSSVCGFNHMAIAHPQSF
jgi:hypothetical protein